MSGPPPAPDLVEFPPLVGKETGSTMVKEGKKTSWVMMAQTGSVLKEHVLSYGSEEGKDFVNVPDEVIQNTVPLWDDLVEGKFMDTAPHVAKIHAIVNKIWPLGNQSIRIEVFEFDKTTIKFRIKGANTRARILRRSMWNIANIPMVVSKWSPEEEEEEEAEITMIPMWVTLRNIPRWMFSWKGLGFIASAVGKPKKLHPDTILCKSFEEAKVFVEADMTKELPKSHHFKTSPGVATEVQFEYPWLPSKCTLCSRWEHAATTCGGKGKQIRILKRKEVTNEQEKAADTDTPSVSQQQEKSNTLVNEVVDLVAIPEGNEVTKGTGDVREGNVVVMESEKEVRDEVGKENENAITVFDGAIVTDNAMPIIEEEGTWYDVSPTKQGRSTLKKNEESSIISSPSRFAILSDEQEENGNTQENDEASEEGEILDDQISGSLDDQKQKENQKQEVVDGTIRRTSTRQSKGLNKSAADNKTQGTSNMASAVGKKRNTKKF